MEVKIKKLHPDAVIPQYATAGAAGFDLVAVEDRLIQPGETKTVSTGLAFEIPEGYEIQIRPRSGVSVRTPLRIPNAPGTIDHDYRGEVKVLLSNTSHPMYSPGLFLRTIDGDALLDFTVAGLEFETGSYIVQKGDRIAQGIIAPVERAEFTVVGELSETKRGAGGFGHTGVVAK
ncbi:deoxyuridine 5'-triphosphate nucleotidohydrolase [Paenibacillus phage Ley]|uniref:dUTP diphosphatase n=3 Tax=Halcyonevirus C7Cdelta TaxID=2845733 RepID=A0A345ASM4_9CAUD|nr:dUTPase [Paenibacillus phage C7Cdelta]AXF39828.1 deoxyuridine 5'-triphosphate nucleotidohydrolase [Paenibacillus phage C7Cdelta]AXF39994.1 deoxyuridine 5'-triphosphate nucleotidohydrolase [Paenibacillus phage Ash]AXF40281.1 deoxyuridine 5'-triphosphate nucleotidohydrolase [Paenibacillus phage Ley]